MDRQRWSAPASSRFGVRLLGALLVSAILATSGREAGAQVNALAGRVTADFSATGADGTWNDVPGLTWYVAANASYAYSCKLVYATSQEDATLRISINGPSSAAHTYTVILPRTATTVSSYTLSGTGTANYDTVSSTLSICSTGGTGCSGTTPLPAVIRGTFENGGAAGTFRIRLLQQNSIRTYTVLRGSFCTVARQ